VLLITPLPDIIDEETDFYRGGAVAFVTVCIDQKLLLVGCNLSQFMTPNTEVASLYWNRVNWWLIHAAWC
jgi:hypothetical protein